LQLIKSKFDRRPLRFVKSSDSKVRSHKIRVAGADNPKIGGDELGQIQALRGVAEEQIQSEQTRTGEIQHGPRDT